MSGEPDKKRSKNFHSHARNYFKKQKKLVLEVGLRGFLTTCNFQENQAVRESFNILNTYANELYGDLDAPPKTDGEVSTSKEDAESKKQAGEEEEEEEEEEDISKVLENEIKVTKSLSKTKTYRFHQVQTGISNLIFIKTSLADPVELGMKIVNDIAATKESPSRYLLRFIPIEVVCKANVVDISNAAGQLFDKYFLNCPPKTFSIVINRRYNNSIDRDEIIHELADLVMFKNKNHKVDLRRAELSVMVEVLKGLCCISVLPNYLKLRKYNLTELVLNKSKVTDKAKVEDHSGEDTGKEKDKEVPVTESAIAEDKSNEVD